MTEPSKFGLIAARGLDGYELLDAFPAIPGEDFGSTREWSWVRFDPDAIDIPAGAVGRAVKGWKCVVLDLRTHAPGTWTLTALPGKAKKATPVHVAFHDPLREAANAKGKTPLVFSEEIARLDAAVPAEFRTPDDLRARAESHARKDLLAVLKVQARAVDDFLVKTDLIQRNSGLAAKLVAWERGEPSDLPGNLRNFLESIGLRQAIDPPDDRWRVGWSADEAGTFNDRSVPMTEIAPPAEPIQGGPVVVSAEDLGLIWLLPWFCDTDSQTDLLITTPPGERVPLPSLDHWIVPHRKAWQTYVEGGWNPPGPRFRAYREIGQALASLPTGTIVEALCGNPSLDEGDAPLTTSNQRYRGVIFEGKWRITEAAPRIKAADLKAALEFCRSIHKTETPYTLASEAAAKAVVAKASKSAWFDDNSKPVAKGVTIPCADPYTRLPLALFVFREKFAGGPWDLQAGQARDEANEASWDELIDSVGQKLGTMLAAPEGGEVILQTEHATFRHADWSMMDESAFGSLGFIVAELFGLDEAPAPNATALLEPVDAALRDLGFRHLGDIYCDRFAELYLRGYVGPEATSCACVIAGTMGQFEYEFVSRFADGASLTTSTTFGLEDKPAKKVYKRSFPETPLAGLFAKHRKLMQSLAKKHGAPRALDPTLEGFCREIDEYIGRELPPQKHKA